MIVVVAATAIETRRSVILGRTHHQAWEAASPTSTAMPGGNVVHSDGSVCNWNTEKRPARTSDVYGIFKQEFLLLKLLVASRVAIWVISCLTALPTVPIASVVLENVQNRLWRALGSGFALRSSGLCLRLC